MLQVSWFFVKIDHKNCSKVWWKDTPKEALSAWNADRVARWVTHNTQDLIGQKQADELSKKFLNNYIDGEVFAELTTKELAAMGVDKIGVQSKIIHRRDTYVKDTMTHMVRDGQKSCEIDHNYVFANEADDNGDIHDIEHLKAPFNWEDMFYNATSEEWLTEPIHKRIGNPATKTAENPEGDPEVVWGLYHMRAVLLETMVSRWILTNGKNLH